MLRIQNKYIKSLFLILGVLLGFTACKKTVENAVMPMNISTLRVNEQNWIHNSFALKNNTFIVMAHTENYNSTIIFQYSHDFKLIDSIHIIGVNYVEPIIEEDGFTMIGSTDLGFRALKLDNELNLVQDRYINHLFKNNGDGIYTVKLIRLANGNYVIGHTYERISASVVYDKIVLFAVNDLFEDNSVLWRNEPIPYDGSWITEMYSLGNDIFIVGNDHATKTGSFIQKNDQDGNLIFKKIIPEWYDFASLYIENDKITYVQPMFLKVYKQDGELIDIIETGNDNDYFFISNLLKIKQSYYYISQKYTSDGLFGEVRRLDEKLNILQTKLYGNHGTNIGSLPKQHFIKLSSGKLVYIANIESPDLTGNHWLLHGIGEDLEPVEE